MIKILLNTDLTVSRKKDESEAQWKEFCDSISGLLFDYCVGHTVVKDQIRIPVQKITVPSQEANELFYHVFTNADTPWTLKYAPLGAEGCPLALEIEKEA